MTLINHSKKIINSLTFELKSHPTYKNYTHRHTHKKTPYRRQHYINKNNKQMYAKKYAQTESRIKKIKKKNTETKNCVRVQCTADLNVD